MTMDKNAKSLLETVSGRLETLRGELQVRNHLAAAEVRDAVDVLVKEVASIATKIESSAGALSSLRDEAKLQGHLAVLEAKDRLHVLEDLLRRALRGAASSPAFLGDVARLKLALGRMDAVDLLEDKKRKLKQELSRLERDADAALLEVHALLLKVSKGALGDPSDEDPRAPR